MQPCEDREHPPENALILAPVPGTWFDTYKGTGVFIIRNLEDSMNNFSKSLFYYSGALKCYFDIHSSV